jgi:hypothetical protein
MLSSANAPFVEPKNGDNEKDAEEHQCAQQQGRMNVEPHHEVASNAEPVIEPESGQQLVLCKGILHTGTRELSKK